MIGFLSFPTCQVRDARFYKGASPLSSSSSPTHLLLPPCQLLIAVGIAGPQKPAPEFSHISTAKKRMHLFVR